MQVISVQYKEEPVTAKFVRLFTGEFRLWLTDPSRAYQTVGQYCPHKNVHWDGCRDCAMDFSE